MSVEMKKFDFVEKKRTYYFPAFYRDKANKNDTTHSDLVTITLNNVTHLGVSDSGTHRLKTEDNKLHIVPTGWLWIELETEDWTF